MWGLGPSCHTLPQEALSKLCSSFAQSGSMGSLWRAEGTCFHLHYFQPFLRARKTRRLGTHRLG